MESYLQGERGISPVDLAAARLLQGRARDGWQQEDLTPAWPPSATAFIRGGKRDGKNKSCDSGRSLAGKKLGKSITHKGVACS